MQHRSEIARSDGGAAARPTAQRYARAGERGMSLVALVAAITIMLIAMAVALPAWRYVAQNEREQELLFRGGQIADAIVEYQKRSGAPPPSLDALVKQRFLRRPFKDPMTKDGNWRFIRMGEPLPACQAQAGGRPGQPPQMPVPLGPAPSPPSAAPSGLTGPFIGVASQSKNKALRKFRNCEKYSEWYFIAGQQREWVFLGGEPRRVPTPQAPQLRRPQPR
jgi:type II secretory pathway pseudopilin PulG